MGSAAPRKSDAAAELALSREGGRSSELRTRGRGSAGIGAGEPKTREVRSRLCRRRFGGNPRRYPRNRNAS